MLLLSDHSIDLLNVLIFGGGFVVLLVVGDVVSMRARVKNGLAIPESFSDSSGNPGTTSGQQKEKQ